MRIELGDPGSGKRRSDCRVERFGNNDKARFARPIKMITNEPLITTACLQQRRPRLGFMNY
jgi:hypothetical protein